MDLRLNLQELKTPEDIQKLVSAISEIADGLDILYTETAPNGNISARIGRIAIYKNGSTYEQWQCVGGTVWQRIDAGVSIPLTYLDTDGTLAANSDTKIATQRATKTYADTKGDMFYANARFKVSSFTRDISLTGTQAITGLGFSPKAVIFFATVESAVGRASWGMDDDAVGTCIVDYGAVTTDTYVVAGSSSISMTIASGVEAYGSISSLDADGFTLTWTKAGSPTGTAVIKYIAFR